jgi:hypothetical protein
MMLDIIKPDITLSFDVIVSGKWIGVVCGVPCAQSGSRRGVTVLSCLSDSTNGILARKYKVNTSNRRLNGIRFEGNFHSHE